MGCVQESMPLVDADATCVDYPCTPTTGEGGAGDAKKAGGQCGEAATVNRNALRDAGWAVPKPRGSVVGGIGDMAGEKKRKAEQGPCFDGEQRAPRANSTCEKLSSTLSRGYLVLECYSADFRT